MRVDEVLNINRSDRRHGVLPAVAESRLSVRVGYRQEAAPARSQHAIFGGLDVLARSTMNLVTRQVRNSGMSGLAPHMQKPVGSNGNWRGHQVASSSGLIRRTPVEYS